MTDSEVNKIIAEYMGLEVEIEKGVAKTCTEDRWWHPLNYTESLDVLVPVWVKLGSLPILMTDDSCTTFRAALIVDKAMGNSPKCLDLHLSAAHATAKAILELR